MVIYSDCYSKDFVAKTLLLEMLCYERGLLPRQCLCNEKFKFEFLFKKRGGDHHASIVLFS